MRESRQGKATPSSQGEKDLEGKYIPLAGGRSYDINLSWCSIAMFSSNIHQKELSPFELFTLFFETTSNTEGKIQVEGFWRLGRRCFCLSA